MSQTLFCTEQDMASLLSDEGLTNFLDFNNEGGRFTTAVTKCRTWGSSRVSFYCSRRYSQALLATSDWVNGHTITFAVYRAVSTMGNGPSATLQQAYDDAIEELKMIQAGKADIPDINVRTNRAPAMSNMRVVPGYTNSDIRVVESTSVNPHKEHDVKSDPVGGVNDSYPFR